MQRLAFLRQQREKYEVYVADFVDGQISNPEQISNQPEVAIYYDLDWSLTGDSLYYVASDKKVYQHFLETSEIVAPYDVAYDAPNSLSINPVTGQLALEVTHNTASTATCRPGIPSNCVLANTTQEKFKYECARNSKINYDIWCYDPAHLCQVNSNDDCSPLMPKEEFDLKLPAWSPDGSLLAYASNREGTMAIYLLDSEGVSQRITKRPAVNFRSISWSPDGQKLLFAYQPAEDRASREICTVNADGSDFSCLTTNLVRDDTPTWSPDGQWIVYSSEVRPFQQLFLMKVEDKSVTQLTQDNANHYNPVWAR